MTDDIGTKHANNGTDSSENSLTVPFSLTRLGVASRYSGQKVALQHRFGPKKYFL